MTFQEFIDYWVLQTKCDYDGSFGNQCMDLFRFYVEQVLKLSQFPRVKGAINLIDVYDKSKFDFIKNELFNKPEYGDIVIFKGGTFGHVSMYIDGNLITFRSFDLNWPSQGYTDKYGNFIGTGFPHIQSHNYLTDKVAGWFHPRESTMSDMYNGYDLSNKESMKVAVDSHIKFISGDYLPKKETEGLITSAKAEKDLYYQKELAGALQTSEDNNFETLIAQVKRLKNELNNANEPIGNVNQVLPTTYNGKEVVGVIIKP